jgi:predicted GNAT family acetyltransferase
MAENAALRDTGRRLEMDEGGHTAYADYRRSGERMYLDYVFCPAAARGSGLSGRLMTAVAEHAREEGMTITPICGYAAHWLNRSAKYRDLVA